MNIEEAITRNIQLRDNVLKVECTPKFLSIVREHFGLHCDSDVKDEHIKLYFYGALKNAVNKVEDPK